VRIIEDLLEFSRKNEVILAPIAIAGWIEHQLAEQARQPTDGGELAINARAEGDALVLSLTDNGCGMSPEVSARMFDPLFSTKAFGVGLGMPLVKRIVEEHGGRVTVQSELGEGTTVVMSLPLRMKNLDS
jgi:signal transduction histidine kinase